MKDKRKQVKEQIKFCKLLMKSLEELIEENVDLTSPYFGIRNNSQIINDIVRLRRELNNLHNLVKTEW